MLVAGHGVAIMASLLRSWRTQPPRADEGWKRSLPLRRTALSMVDMQDGMVVG
jgi:hypothetical protein